MPHPAGAFLIYLLLTLVVVRVTAPAGLARRRATLLLTGFLAVLLPLGQAAENPRVLYPFVSWNMYAAPVPPEHLEYVAVDDRGRAFLYPFRLVAFSSPWAFMARLDEVIDRCACRGGAPLADRALEALARLHEAKTGRAIVRVEAYARWTAGPAGRELTYVWMSSGEPAEERP